jgi:Transforming growth factor beta like domain
MKKAIVGLVLLASCAAPNDDDRVGAPAGGGPEKTAEQAQAIETFGACTPGQWSCCVAPQTINFDDFPGSSLEGGYDSIIAPRSIEIGRAQGDCSPSPSNYHAMNNRLTSPQFPRCVPVEFASMSILYENHDGTVSFLNTPDVVVTRAGCR